MSLKLTPLVIERVERSTGVVISQDAKSKEEPSILSARHGDRNERGTTQDVPLGMKKRTLDLLTNYGFHLSSSYATRTPETDYVVVSEPASYFIAATINGTEVNTKWKSDKFLKF